MFLVAKICKRALCASIEGYLAVFASTPTSATLLSTQSFRLFLIALVGPGRDDFGLFWNFNTGKQIPPCVIETRRYGYILGSGGRVETPRHTSLVGEKSLINVKK